MRTTFWVMSPETMQALKELLLDVRDHDKTKNYSLRARDLCEELEIYDETYSVEGEE